MNGSVIHMVTLVAFYGPGKGTSLDRSENVLSLFALNVLGIMLFLKFLSFDVCSLFFSVSSHFYPMP